MNQSGRDAAHSGQYRFGKRQRLPEKFVGGNEEISSATPFGRHNRASGRLPGEKRIL